MKTILITGANGNLGAVTVKKFLDSGYRVIAAARSGSNLGFAGRYENFELHQVDLSDEKASGLFVSEAVKLYGSIEGALFLAGGFAAGTIETTTGDDLKKMIALNFDTVYHIAKTLFPHMLQADYGRLVFTGARPALVAAQGKHALAYALSKSLIFNLAEILNESAKGKNVTASVIVPSTIDTPPNRESMPDADWSKWVQPEEIADTLEFICSDKSMALREPIYKLYRDV